MSKPIESRVTELEARLEAARPGGLDAATRYAMLDAVRRDAVYGNEARRLAVLEGLGHTSRDGLERRREHSYEAARGRLVEQFGADTVVAFFGE